MKNIIKLSGVLALVVLFMTGCPAPLYNVDKQEIKTEKKMSLDEVFAKIKEAGQLTGWNITKTGPNEAAGTLKIRVHVAHVKIKFDESSYGIKYNGGTNLSYEPIKGTIHENYNKWVKNLAHNIDTQLAN